MYQRFFFRLFSLLTFVLLGCETGVPEPEIVPLEIVVVDETDGLVQDANITFFLTEQDFITKENPVNLVAWKTDRFGKVIIDELDRTIPQYYVSVEAADANNWSSKTVLKWANNPKRLVVQVKRSLANYLAGRSTRKWKQISQTINGEVFTDCTRRRNLVFNRLYRMQNFRPADCTPDKQESLIREEDWAEEGENVLLLGSATSPEGIRRVTVLELTNSTFRYSYQPIRNGQRITVVEDFAVAE